MTPPVPSDPGVPRTGYVALVGRPNAGKSTLLNAFVGEKLSIVTPKPQTTWQRVTGIVTTGAVQTIFLDTPGLLEPRDLLQRSMLDQALAALGEADVVLVVVDATQPMDPASVELALASSRAPRLVAVNKVDAAPAESVRAQLRWAEEALGAQAFAVSALRGTGVPELTTAIARALPEGPFLYPPDEIASEPVRFFVAELVRETVFERYRQEIPYSVFCRVEEMREEQDPAYIEVGVFVERESQKGILVGKGGAGVRELGRVSREKIEHFLGRPVYLELWVKTLPGWRKKRGDLTRLGFRVPEES
jgi:GTP-binding protein Era